MSIKKYQEVSAEALDRFLQIPVEMVATEDLYFVDKKEIAPKFEDQNYILSNFVIPCIKSNQTLKQYFGGDIQKFSEKLPGFIWSKYPKEKHLPSYNYLGPGKRLDIRLTENNIPKPGEEPINEIDRLAYVHDLAYQKSSNIQDRHRADLAMIEGIKGLQNLSFPQS